MKKNILLISGNYFPEPTGIGKYNNEMMTWLADHGFNCTIISTYPYYPFWQVQAPYIKKRKWFSKQIYTTPTGNKLTVYRCPHYVPQNPTGKSRVLLDLSFFSTVSLKLIRLTGKKFHYIINVTPPLSLGLLAALYKKVCGAKFLYHIQDMQVDVANDLKMISSMRFLSILFKIEKYILKEADKISSISPDMVERVKFKSGKPAYLFPNWVNTKLFFPLPDKTNLKVAFGFKPDAPIVLYSGSIGEKQGLEAVLEIADNFKQKNIEIQFIISGSGPYKNVLEKLALEKKLSNLSFLPLQPSEKLNEFLNMADVHLVMQKANVAHHVMPSKLTTILSVGGLAIITANAGSGLYKMVTDHNIGLISPAENIPALSALIELALHNNYADICNNARKYAEDFLAIDKIMVRYKEEVINAAQ
ncbi:MAG TPA: WcaI family glycosyltransferase [Parafilimonas sp.]